MEILKEIELSNYIITHHKNGTAIIPQKTSDEMQGKNFIVESIKSQDCFDVDIYFYKDKTIEITDFLGKSNIKYIDMKMLKKAYKTCQELRLVRR